jgi:hypothetical protein
VGSDRPYLDGDALDAWRCEVRLITVLTLVLLELIQVGPQQLTHQDQVLLQNQSSARMALVDQRNSAPCYATPLKPQQTWRSLSEDTERRAVKPSKALKACCRHHGLRNQDLPITDLLSTAQHRTKPSAHAGGPTTQLHSQHDYDQAAMHNTT